MKMNRLCTRCHELKPETEFYKATKGQRGLRAVCKKCHNEKSDQWQKQNREQANANARNWRARNPEKVRISALRHYVRKHYGMTLEEYNALTQNARCAICRKKIKPGKHCLDHCHESGRVREVLCGKCNTGLGCFRDDPELLELAAEYLRRHADS